MKHTPGGEAIEENARLFAAAPELLAALQGIEHLFGKTGDPALDNLFALARAAIAKATS